MDGKIALEEHFAIDDTLMDSAGFVPETIGRNCGADSSISKTGGLPKWTGTGWR